MRRLGHHARTPTGFLILLLAAATAWAGVVSHAEAARYGRISDFDDGHVDGWTAVGGSISTSGDRLKFEASQPTAHLLAAEKFQGDWRCRVWLQLDLQLPESLFGTTVRVVIRGADGQEAHQTKSDWGASSERWSLRLWHTYWEGEDDFQALLEDVEELRIEFPGLAELPPEDLPETLYLDHVRVRVRDDTRLVTFEEPSEPELREFATLQEAFDSLDDPDLGAGRHVLLAAGTHATQGELLNRPGASTHVTAEGCSEEPTVLRPLVPGRPIFHVANTLRFDLRRLVMENGQAALGGALRVERTDVAQVADCTFRDNAAGAGGAIYAEDVGLVRSYLSTFERNQATAPASDVEPHGGGAIAHHHPGPREETTRFEIYRGSVFRENRSASDGGALSIRNVDHFAPINAPYECRDNEASDRGGAVFIRGARWVVLRNSQSDDEVSFVDNRAHAGGAVYVDGLEPGSEPWDAALSIREVSFIDNQASVDGGALRVKGPLAPRENGAHEVENCLFNGNTAEGRGGAVSLENASGVHFRENEYRSNQAFSGGAVHVTGRSAEPGVAAVRFQGETFGDPDDSLAFPLNRNVAQDRGGALFIEDGDVEVNLWRDDEGVETRTLFAHDQSANRGGAIAVVGTGLVEVSNTDFLGNVSGLHGGAVSIEGEGRESDLVVNLYSNSYDGNLTQVGGGAVDAEGVAELHLGGTATGNHALSEISGHLGHGGAYSLRDVGSVLVNGSLVDNTAAGDGGALHASGVDDFRVSAQEFRGNLARGGEPEGQQEAGRGGAVFLEDIGMGAVNVDMSDNRAGWGGALFARDVGHAGLLEFSRSTVENNRGWWAGGGLRLEDSAGTFVDSEFEVLRGTFAVALGSLTFRNNETADWPEWNGWPAEPPGVGGGVSVAGAAVRHSQLVLLGNRAEYGGALAVSGGRANRVLAGALGGIPDELIEPEPDEPGLTVERCFEETPNGPGNEAFSHGGGLYVLETEVELQPIQEELAEGWFADCAMVLRNNVAGLTGGGIAVHGTHEPGDPLPDAGAHVVPEDSPCATFPTPAARLARAALELHETRVQENTAALAGGGIAVLGHEPLAAYRRADSDRLGGAFLEMHAGEVSGNRVESSASDRLGGGGGLYLSGHAVQGSRLDGVTVSANESNTWGAGLVAAAPADFVLEGGTVFAENGAGAGGAPVLDGGGLYLTDGARLLIDGDAATSVELRDNTASGAGGGVHLRAGAQVHSRHVLLSGNQALDGGGIFAHEAATCLGEGSSLSANRATGSGGGLRAQSGPSASPDPPWSVSGHSHLALGGALLTENHAAGHGGGASIEGDPADAATRMHVQVDSSTRLDANAAAATVTSGWFPAGMPTSGLDLAGADGALVLASSELEQHLDGAALTLRCDDSPACAGLDPAVLDGISFRLNDVGAHVTGGRPVRMRESRFEAHGAAGLVLTDAPTPSLVCCSTFSENETGIGLKEAVAELRGNLLESNTLAVEARLSTIGDGGVGSLVTGNELRARSGVESHGMAVLFEGSWPTDPSALGSQLVLAGNDLHGFVETGDFAYHVDLSALLGPGNPAEACPPFFMSSFAMEAPGNHWGCAGPPLDACSPRPEGNTCGRITHAVQTLPALGEPVAADRALTCLDDPCTEPLQ